MKQTKQHCGNQFTIALVYCCLVILMQQLRKNLSSIPGRRSYCWPLNAYPKVAMFALCKIDSLASPIISEKDTQMQYVTNQNTRRVMQTGVQGYCHQDWKLPLDPFHSGREWEKLTTNSYNAGFAWLTKTHTQCLRTHYCSPRQRARCAYRKRH